MGEVVDRKRCYLAGFFFTRDRSGNPFLPFRLSRGFARRDDGWRMAEAEPLGFFGHPPSAIRLPQALDRLLSRCRLKMVEKRARGPHARRHFLAAATLSQTSAIVASKPSTRASAMRIDPGPVPNLPTIRNGPEREPSRCFEGQADRPGRIALRLGGSRASR